MHEERIKSYVHTSAVAARLKSLRIKFRRNQQDIADHCQVTVRCVAHWEKGTRRVSGRRATQLAQFYKVTTDYILNGTTKGKDKP